MSDMKQPLYTTTPFGEISEYVDIMESEEYQIATTAEQRAARRKQRIHGSARHYYGHIRHCRFMSDMGQLWYGHVSHCRVMGHPW